MAITRKGRSIQMTANGDSIAAGNIFCIAGVTLQGSGMTPGQRLLLTDANDSVIADYLVASATDNADLINGRDGQFYNGLTLIGPAAGTWVLTLILE